MANIKYKTKFLSTISDSMAESPSYSYSDRQKWNTTGGQQ